MKSAEPFTNSALFFQIQDTRYKIQDTRYKIQDTRYKIQDTIIWSSQILNSNYGSYKGKRDLLMIYKQYY